MCSNKQAILFSLNGESQSGDSDKRGNFSEQSYILQYETG